MANRGWDVVVVGGGLIGSAAAYHLAKRGARTLLVEQGDLASGASGANFGLVQVQDAEFGLSLELTLRGYETFSSLEAELDYDVGYRRTGSLLLIENEEQWSAAEARAANLQAAGLPVQLVGRDGVYRLEPSLSPESAIGALYHADEGELNPFKLVQAYVQRGQEHGLEVWTHTEVTGVNTQGGRVTGAGTQRGQVAAGWVVLAAGAWARRLARTAGVDLPLHWVLGEAFVTERLAPLTRHSIGSAAFYEAMEGSEGQAIGFCLRQRPEGNVLIGESTFVTRALGRHVTASALPANRPRGPATLSWPAKGSRGPGLGHSRGLCARQPALAGAGGRGGWAAGSDWAEEHDRPDANRRQVGG